MDLSSCLAVFRWQEINSPTVRARYWEDSLHYYLSTIFFSLFFVHYLSTKAASIDECVLRFSNVDLPSGFWQICQSVGLPRNDVTDMDELDYVSSGSS